MAVLKKPYEISIWIEKLGTNGEKIEEKGLIIGAHDMSYLGRATGVVLRREIKGTNTLTFQMPDRYFDSLSGEYVRNEFIDELFPERKLKLFYDGEWFEFFIKNVSEKKILKSFIKTFTCKDSFIDELSRNGYGITFDEELYNNVEEAGTFTEEVLEDSIWEYHPEHNWGDFSEFKEEKLYKIPVSQFGGTISGYKLWFELTDNQRKALDIKEISNVYTNESRNVEMSDDVARTMFWDQQNLNNPNGEKENPLKARYIENIENDGYIYVPYSCLNFCYGSEKNPDEILKYDRAATEIALSVNNKLVLAPDSVDPRTIIQFLAIPKNAKIEIDDAGVILNRNYHFFMTLREWNEMIQNNIWYFFEDTRIVSAETLGSEDLMNAQISHTYRYLYQGEDQILDTYKESWGNKAVFYDGYLSDISNTNIIKGKKYSITDRTEINISEEIDQYVTVYNNSPDEYRSQSENLYMSDDWNYEVGDNKYRVCSKLKTRQVIPQLARNLIQNGIAIKSTDGWAPMHYLETDLENSIYSAAINLKTLTENILEEDIKGTALYYSPPYKSLAYVWEAEEPLKIGNYPLYYLYSIGSDYYYIPEGHSINDDTPLLLFFANQTETPYNYTIRDIRSHYNQTNHNSFVKIYPHSTINGDVISWSISKDGLQKDYSVNIELPDYSFINFGIIGQKKNIEKDKIYCLGIAAAARDNFSIYIGKGSLISTGNYNLSEDFIKIDSSVIFEDNPDSIKIDFDWNGLNSNDINISLSPDDFPKRYILFRAPKTMENPYFIIQSKKALLINEIQFFEAYTKGYDSFQENEAPYYRYSGRDLFGTEQPDNYKNEPWRNSIPTENNEISFEYSHCFEQEDIRKRILFEDVIMLGSTYSYQQYYIQRLRTLPPIDSEEERFYDTCGAKSFITSDKNIIEGKLPLDESKYSEDNYTIETNYINLNKCRYYVPSIEAKICDCCYGGATTKTCYYQKFGYCPYRFETEKHNRRIRTLKISKSNRFNILQEISKIFEFYPQFWIEHKENGKIIRNSDGSYSKQFFYITEKGMENKIGFRYEKNLKDISREINSDQIVTKLYIEDVDSEISKTGLCSIKTAEDNPSKDNFIIDMSYYIAKGMLDEDEVNQDLYGISPIITNSIDTSDELPQGFLRQLGYYNTRYDEISNKIINLQSESFDELNANLIVNLEGITTAQEQLLKIKQQMERFNTLSTGITSSSQSYENYKRKYKEQESILLQLIQDTFFTNGIAAEDKELYNNKYGISNLPLSYTDPVQWFSCISDYDKMKENWVDKHLYTKGILGQYNKEYNQIQAWKKERASYLKLINRISTAFYKKYEPYLKEGTWTDSNYLTDNAYYFGALDVAAQGSIPKVSYTIAVLDLGVYERYEDVYKVGLADTTYIEDIGMFGINKRTGFPNRLKVIVSEISYNLDDMSKVDIKVQNFTTQFEDLFQQVTASVQSLTYNENIYKRSSNFTSLQNIKTSSLQGALDTNNLTLLNTEEQNIQLDNTGTHGSDINNHANKYKLNGQGLFFSNDGGQHWNVGVGPSGINADYIKVGQLDASKIKIVDGNYIYFGWDKNGIVSYRDPQSSTTTSQNLNDYSLFNKYGLSIVENGNIKLRAGYDFNGINGQMSTEQEPGNEIGFYLYNSDGKRIFSTSTAISDSSKNKDTARLALVGEMFVTDTLGSTSIDEKIYTYKYSKRVYSPYASTSAYLAQSHGNYTLVNGYKAQMYGVDYEVTAFCMDGAYMGGKKIMEIIDGNDQHVMFIAVPALAYPNNLYSNGETFIDTYIDLDVSSTRMVRYIIVDNNANVTSSISVEKTFLFNSDLSNYTIIPENVLQDTQGYAVNGNWYLEKEKIEDSGITVGAAAIFINNKTEFSGESLLSGTQRRLLCVTKIEDGLIKNVFTILKDGTLHIGGVINSSAQALNELPDAISISDSKIRLSTEGALQLAFSNISDTESNMNLSQYIQSVVGSSQSSSGMYGHVHGLPIYGPISIAYPESAGVIPLYAAINTIIDQLNGRYLLEGTETYGW